MINESFSIRLREARQMMGLSMDKLVLWFDVGIKRYTTDPEFFGWMRELWFDVGIKRYTTDPEFFGWMRELWFDVGIKRYTTH